MTVTSHSKQINISKYKYQDDINKKGEIIFRKGIAEKEKDNIYQILSMLKKRIHETVDIFRRLEKKYAIQFHKNMLVGEFGAERAQRVLALIDHYQLEKAYAFDISPDMLRLSKEISELCFQRTKSTDTLPHERLELVADDFLKAKELIAPQQLDFVFCFATIHHFPDPRPVFQTVYSILKDGGYFYFDREALKSLLGLHEVARFRTYLQHGKIPEREYGILETQFSLNIWKEAFDIFDDCDIHIKYPLPVIEKIYNFNLRTILKNGATKAIAQLLGGRVYGILRKKEKLI